MSATTLISSPTSISNQGEVCNRETCLDHACARLAGRNEDRIPEMKRRTKMTMRQFVFRNCVKIPVPRNHYSCKVIISVLLKCSTSKHEMAKFTSDPLSSRGEMHARNVREIKFSSLTSVKVIHSLPFVHSQGIFTADQITTRKIIYFGSNSIYRKRGVIRKHFGSGPYRGTGSNPSKRFNLPRSIGSAYRSLHNP